MLTSVTKRGQTVIPVAIRNKYQIKDGDHIVWVDDGQTIKIIPAISQKAILVHKDPEFDSINEKIQMITLPY